MMVEDRHVPLMQHEGCHIRTIRLFLFFVLRVMRQTNGKHKHLLVEHVLPMFIVSLSLSQHV